MTFCAKPPVASSTLVWVLFSNQREDSTGQARGIFDAVVLTVSTRELDCEAKLREAKLRCIEE